MGGKTSGSLLAVTQTVKPWLYISPESSGLRWCNAAARSPGNQDLSIRGNGHQRGTQIITAGL